MEPTAIGPDGTKFYECHLCGDTLDPNAQHGLRWAWPRHRAWERILVCDDCWEECWEVWGADPEEVECGTFDLYHNYGERGR